MLSLTFFEGVAAAAAAAGKMVTAPSGRGLTGSYLKMEMDVASGPADTATK